MTQHRFVTLAKAIAVGIAVTFLLPVGPAYADEVAPSESAAPAESTAPAEPTPSADGGDSGGTDSGSAPATSEPAPSASDDTTSAAPAPSDSPSPSDSESPSPSPSEPSPSDPSPSDPGSPSPSDPAGSSPAPSKSPPSSKPPADKPGSGDRWTDTPDPGADLYPQPPFAPIAGNRSAALLQKLYDAQTRQRSLHNQISLAEIELTAAESVITDAKVAVGAARQARDRASQGLQSSVVEIYKSGAPYDLYSALESGDFGVGPNGAQGKLKAYSDAAERYRLLADQLAGAVDGRDALIVKLSDLRTSLRKADATVKRIQKQTASNLSTAAAPAGASDGVLLWPVRGTITSQYGNRYDPYYNRWQLHAGIDIAAPTGTPVGAAAAGRVIQAGWNGGYGNYICVAHGVVRGQQLSTCYAHLSQILTAAGHSVKAGQTIGRVGSTGASTGPHLHFEVRLGGRPTDPRLWL